MPKTPNPPAEPADEAATIIVEPEPDTGEPVFEGSLSSTEPLVAPDGHVTLSQEDIEARDAES